MKIIPVDTQIAIRWLKRQSYDNATQAMCEWMKLYTGCSFDPDVDVPYIYDHAKKLFVEYITGCSNPGTVSNKFLDWMSEETKYNVYQIAAINCIVRILRSCRIKSSDGEYINGFTDISQELCDQYNINK